MALRARSGVEAAATPFSASRPTNGALEALLPAPARRYGSLIPRWCDRIERGGSILSC